MRKFHVIGGPNACDQIAFFAFHSFLVEVQTNSTLKIWIAGSSGRAQLHVLNVFGTLHVFLQECGLFTNMSYESSDWLVTEDWLVTSLSDVFKQTEILNPKLS